MPRRKRSGKVQGVRQLPDGRWQARWLTLDGKEHKQIFDTQVEAIVHREKHHLQKAVSPDMTVAAFSVLYLEKVEGNGCPRGYANIVSSLKNHILPSLGKRKLTDLQYADGEALVKKMNLTLSSGTVRRIWNTVKALLNYAVERHKILTVNPFHKVPLPKKPKPRDQWLDNATLALLRPCGSAELSEAIDVLGNTGLRPGKALELEASGMRQYPDGPWGLVPDPEFDTKDNPPQTPLNDLVMAVYQGKTGRVLPTWPTVQALSNAFHAACCAAGLIKRDAHGKPLLSKAKTVQPLFQLRDLRRTFCTRVEDLDVKYTINEWLMGHTLPGVGETYRVLTPKKREQIRNAVTLLAQSYGPQPKLRLVNEI